MAQIIALATRYGRYGYRRITALLRVEGWQVNHKRVERIWRQEGLRVPQKQPKRGRLWLNEGCCIRLRPERKNHVWSYDLMAARTQDGSLLEEVDILMKRGEKTQLLTLEQEFHMKITEATGNWLLTEIMRSVFDRVWTIQNVNILTSDDLTYAHKQHMDLYKALEKADPVKSAALMKKHLKFTKKFILSRLQDSDDFLSKLIMGFPEARQFETIQPREG